MRDDTSLSDRFRQPGDPESMREAVDIEVRRAAEQMLGAALPLDVHHRYAQIRSAEAAEVTRLAENVRRTLTNAQAGPNVLSGKVAEAVKRGIHDIVSNTEYTAGVDSIR